MSWAAFRDPAQAPLEISRLMVYDRGANFGRDALMDQRVERPWLSVHLALSRSDKSVRAFHNAALRAGAVWLV